jgi:hypothetical protein
VIAVRKGYSVRWFSVAGSVSASFYWSARVVETVAGMGGSKYGLGFSWLDCDEWPARIVEKELYHKLLLYAERASILGRDSLHYAWLRYAAHLLLDSGQITAVAVRKASSSLLGKVYKRDFHPKAANSWTCRTSIPFCFRTFFHYLDLNNQAT